MSSQFRTLYEREVALGMVQIEPEVLVTDHDLAKLPSILQNYLCRVGVVGRPRVQNFRVQFIGQIRRNHRSGWMRIQAEQHSFLGRKPARLFLLKAAVLGIPFEGLHRFVGPTAIMRVRVASLFQVVDAKGPEMNQGETVTYFNDLCLLAPAALLDVDVTWEEGQGRTLKGTFRHQGQCVSAVLHFNELGDLVDFVSDDRFQSSDGKTYRKYPWSTPVRGWRDFKGFHLPAQADAVWLEPEGPFPYARFEVQEIVYNVRSPRSECS